MHAWRSGSISVKWEFWIKEIDEVMDYLNADQSESRVNTHTHTAPVYAHSDSRRATFYGLRIFAVARIRRHVLRPHCLRGNLARRVIDRSIALTRHAGRTSCVRQWRNFPRLTDNRLRRHLYTKCQSAIYIAIGFNLLSELYRVSEKSALFKPGMVSRLRAILSTRVAVKLRQGHSRTSFRTFTIVHVEMKR